MSEEQLHFPGFDSLVNPLEEKQNAQKQPEATQLVLPEQIDIMPNTLSVAAQSSTSLRGVLEKVANIITQEDYLATMAAIKPEVIPALFDSLNNAVATSDNLLIRMAQVAEKNASMNKVFEIMTSKKKAEEQQTKTEEKTKYELDSIDKIKKAIYRRLDEERDSRELKGVERYRNTDEETFGTSNTFIEADYEIKDDIDNV